MDLIKEKERLITKLEQYLKEECSHEEISNHAWAIIEYFSKKDSSELPERTDFEPEFWYTIWQIQHLADEQHWGNSLTQVALKKALAYLKKEEAMPKHYSGQRP